MTDARSTPWSNRGRAVVAAWMALVVGGCAGVKQQALESGLARDSLESDSTIVAIDFSRDSRYFAHLAKNGTLSLRDVVRDKDAGTRQFTPGAEQLALGSDGRFAVVTKEGIEVWSSTSRRAGILPLPAHPIQFLRFDSNSQRLIVAERGGTLTIWNTDSGESVRRLTPETVGRGIQLMPGAGFGAIYTIGANKIRLLGLGANAPDITLQFERAADSAVATSGDGTRLATVNPHGEIEVRRLPTGELTQTLSKLDGPPRALSLSRDGSVLAVDASSGAVEIWDTIANDRLDRFESTVWPGSGLSFSPDGYLAVWVEKNRKLVRFWSVARGVVQWTPEGPLLIEKARAFCPNLASAVRYRIATGPFDRGTAHLEKDELDKAIAEFEKAEGVFPTYPGLAQAADQARGRRRGTLRAREISREIDELLAAGDYSKSVSMIEEFLREFARYGDFGLASRADKLRTVLQHFQTAEAHKQGGRRLDAVEEFERAVAILPGLKQQHPEYVALRKQLLNELTAAADQAFTAEQWDMLPRIYSDLLRLRPLTAKSYLRLGIAHEQAGETLLAEQAYDAVPPKTAEYPRARQNLARMARASGLLELARSELEKAREAAPREARLETEYAEVCELLRDLDAAIAAWQRVAELDFRNPAPFETIGRIEFERREFERSGEAYRQAIRRSAQPRPDLLVKVAEAYKKAGDRAPILDAYVDLLALVDSGLEIPWLGSAPRRKVLNWIRELGFVRHRGEWISEDQFLAEQGWIRYGGRWLRPEEAQLAAIADRFEDQAPKELRALPEERYRQEALNRGILKGMNRREVIRAWGFFEDQNLWSNKRNTVAYEQLLFANGRQVYLRNGLVCFWSE